MKIFDTVLSDYVDELGRVAIDGYITGAEQGTVVVWVDKTGLVIPGEYSKPEYLTCELIQVSIRNAVVGQLAKTRPDPLSKVIDFDTREGYILNVISSLDSMLAAIEKLDVLWEMDAHFALDINRYLSTLYPFHKSFPEMSGLIKDWHQDATTKLSKICTVPAQYVSVWDDGQEVKTACLFDKLTMTALEVESTDEVEELDLLNEEFIELNDGTIIKTFMLEDGRTVVGGKVEQEL